MDAQLDDGRAPPRLSMVESQRCIAVLEETLEKLAFLGSITPDVLQHRDELSQFVGDEISRIISEQRELEARYEELIAQRGALKGLANKSKYKSNQCEIQDVSRALRESTKNLCRNLKDNPNIGGNLLKIQKERNDLQDLLQRTVGEIREGGTFVTLLQQVRDDQAAQARIEEIIERERETTAAVHQLDAELANEKLQHQREVQSQKAAIAQLKEQLQQIKSKTTVDTKYARREARAKTASTLRTYQQSIRQSENQIRDLRNTCDMEETVHNQTVSFLQRRQEQLVEECAAWGEKYQTELEAKEQELATLTANRERNLERLTTLQERWEQERTEKMQREAEERRLAELEELRREEERRSNIAATHIQTAWRAYAARKAEEERRREAESGGKKKKKGKKGRKK